MTWKEHLNQIERKELTGLEKQKKLTSRYDRKESTKPGKQVLKSRIRWKESKNPERLKESRSPEIGKEIKDPKNQKMQEKTTIHNNKGHLILKGVHKKDRHPKDRENIRHIVNLKEKERLNHKEDNRV